MTKDIGRVLSAPGSREPSPEGLGPSGFDPSRSAICDLQRELRRRQSAVAKALVASKAVEWLGKYGRGALQDRGFARSVEGSDEAGEYTLRALSELSAEINDRAMAMAEADIAAAFSDSDESPKGGDARGSVHDSAGLQGIAPKVPS